MNKQTIISGIKPSGEMHLGSYLGAVKNWVELQKTYLPLFCIVDLHAITVEQDPKLLNKRTLDLAKWYIACGINPEESLIFVQSHVPAHAQLSWILNCFTYMGELEKMTQYKDKTADNKQRATVGLFDYPVLMAADILLYQPDLVPVGEDQVQHIELARDIAKRFNNRFKTKTFKIPKSFTPKAGARVKGLQYPEVKMSKSSDNINDIIYLHDEPELIEKKIMKAVTDADMMIAFDPENKPGISNLLQIYSALTEQSPQSTAKQLADLKYGEFKKLVAKTVLEELKPIQEKYHELSDEEVSVLLRENAQKVQKIANKTLNAVMNEVGFLPKYL